MRANKTNKKNTKTNQRKNRSISCEKINSKEFENRFFKGINMDIKDDFIDPMDNIPGFDELEEKMFKGFKNDFGLLLDEEKNPRKNAKKSNRKNYKDGTVFSKVYCSSYNNINGKEHEEKYQSQRVQQMNNGHNISETKEAYKNSNGVQKTAYQRNLDGKTARFIKENNTKTGKKNQKRVVKGIEENRIKDFNKEYNDYCKKCGFKKNFHNLDAFDPFGFNKKQNLLTDGNLLLHSLLF